MFLRPIEIRGLRFLEVMYNVIIFQHFKTRVIMQFIEKDAPFVTSIHYIVATWSCKQFQAYRWLQKLKPYLQSMYVHFSHSPRRHVGHGKLVKNLSNKRFENPSQFQNLMDIRAWTC
jgi:hypothetical protein